ncbi:hypothetical protein DFH11DRAFT_1775143 [Phellopilus nigrolimitatus]|nr:hypothetical protein DFH11DRAFT_1775143 [Phellopilus nigrolimitatus]
MQPDGNFHAQKRFGDDDGLDTSLLKRFKLERTKEPVKLETSDEGLQVPTKSCTRGVERIVPYPSNCRPNTENYGWNRRQLVLNVKRLLAVKGKRVYGVPRFLDDGVTFDWVLDNSAMAMLRDEESEEFTTSPSAIEETVKPEEKVNPSSINSIKVEATSSKDEDFIMRIPGLELYNSGVMPLPHYSSGTVENPIQILGSDGLEPPQMLDHLLEKKDAPVSEWCESSAAQDEIGVCRANSLFKAVPTAY